MDIKRKTIEYYQQFYANKLVRFLERHKVSKLNQEAIDNVKEIEFIVPNISMKKTVGPDGFTSRFCQPFMKE